MSVTILQGDCREVLATLPEQSVHCVVTSPPYWGLRDYGVPGQLGLERTPEEYVARLVAVFRAVRRVLRDDGTLWLNLGDCYATTPAGGVGASSRLSNPVRQASVTVPRHSIVGALKPKDLVGIPWRVAFGLRADGWWLRQEIIWHKRAAMPESVRDRPTRVHEQLFLLAKSARYFYDADAIAEPCVSERSGNRERHVADGRGRPADHLGTGCPWENDGRGRNKRSVWTLGPEPFRGDAHFAVMPTALVAPCVLAGTSARGCCPTCGAPWQRVPFQGGRPVPARMVRWRPGCRCPRGGDAEVVPCTVLDPFAGSGTVGRVAEDLGRHSILIELSPDYCEMARRRTAQQGLFAREAAR